MVSIIRFSSTSMFFFGSFFFSSSFFYPNPRKSSKIDPPPELIISYSSWSFKAHFMIWWSLRCLTYSGSIIVQPASRGNSNGNRVFYFRSSFSSACSGPRGALSFTLVETSNVFTNTLKNPVSWNTFDDIWTFASSIKLPIELIALK